MRTICISLALGALVLAGCGDDEEETAAEPTEAESPPTAAEQAVEEANEAMEAVDEAEASGEMDIEAAELTCESFIDHLVELMGEMEGSFITADNRDQWVHQCKTAGNLHEHHEIASCILSADTIEASQACGEARFINQWATME